MHLEYHQWFLNVSPLSYFCLLFGDDIFDLIARETNLYAYQKGNLDFDVPATEMAAFFGINIAMGVVNLPKIHDYWSTIPILRHPWFSQVMSRNRFFQILKYLHFNDNTHCLDRVNPMYDKLYKIRPILDIVKDTFPTNYTPFQHVSIDEQMIGTKG